MAHQRKHLLNYREIGTNVCLILQKQMERPVI
jgi:hypothetical protein